MLATPPGGGLGDVNCNVTRLLAGPIEGVTVSVSGVVRGCCVESDGDTEGWSGGCVPVCVAWVTTADGNDAEAAVWLPHAVMASIPNNSMTNRLQ